MPILAIRSIGRLLRAAVLCVPCLTPIESQAQSPYPVNQQPAFGDGEKSAPMVAADQAFIEKAISIAGTREGALDRAVQLGWQYLAKGDMKGAMTRFNQAWLLGPDDARPYWGFAIVTYKRGDGLTESEHWFAETLKRTAPVPNLHSDYGRVLEESGEPERAIQQFRMALELDPNFPEAHVGMLRSYLRLGRSQEALKHAEALQEFGYPISQTVIDQIKKQQ